MVFGKACRTGRLALDLSQQELADALGIHRGHLANIEAGRTNISVDLMERIAHALGQRLDLIVQPPRLVSQRPTHDTVHAWCSGYVARRLLNMGWSVAREVDVSGGGGRGWIDLLAFDPAARTVVVVEIKTRLDDLGLVERQIAWYEAHAFAAAERLGWSPRRSATWLIVLASDEVDRTLVTGRDAINQAFPGRAPDMLAALAGTEPTGRRALAMVALPADGHSG